MTAPDDLGILKNTGDAVLDAAFDLTGAQVRATLAEVRGDTEALKAAQRASFEAVTRLIELRRPGQPDPGTP